jgi:hypothetical protein
MSTFQVLATHKTIAEFTGIQHFPCRHMTSLCPDRCTHAHDAAVFNIVEYESYEKPGQYGDEKQSVYRVRLDNNGTTDKQDPALIAVIKDLAPGQRVRLSWEHIYVSDNGSKYPERPLRSIEKL